MGYWRVQLPAREKAEDGGRGWGRKGGGGGGEGTIFLIFFKVCSFDAGRFTVQHSDPGRQSQSIEDRMRQCSEAVVQIYDETTNAAWTSRSPGDRARFSFSVQQRAPQNTEAIDYACNDLC